MRMKFTFGDALLIIGFIALLCSLLVYFVTRYLSATKKKNEPPVEDNKPLLARYGYPEEWAAFSARHQEFLKRFENIEKAIKTAFLRIQQTTGPLEKVIYLQGRLVGEEFMEVLLLCGNGYGIGAQKLVRGMYERAVTARYLMGHPEEAEQFLEFHHIANYKFLMAIEQSLGQDIFSPEQANKIRKDYEGVKAQFMIPDCKMCGTFRLNHTWSKVDVVSMARMTKNLWPFISSGYYLPLREAHSTAGAIFSRLDSPSVGEEKGLFFGGDAQRDTAHRALFTAHMILLDALELQWEYFKIEELESQMQTCMRDYSEIWK